MRAETAAIVELRSDAHLSRGVRPGRGSRWAVVALASMMCLLPACSRTKAPARVPVIDVRARGADADTPLPDNIVVLRSDGDAPSREAPPQALVDQVGAILPGSREATVWFAGLENGRILEPHCSDGTIEKGCGEEAGFADAEVLDLLGLGDVDDAITEHAAAVAFDRSVVSDGKVTLFTDSDQFDLPAVVARSGRTWLGLPTIWIPDLQPPRSGVVPLPFAVVIASPDPLTDEQYAALDSLEQNLQQLWTLQAQKEYPDCAGAVGKGSTRPNTPPTTVGPGDDQHDAVDACEALGAVDAMTNGYTAIYTSRSAA